MSCQFVVDVGEINIEFRSNMLIFADFEIEFELMLSGFGRLETSKVYFESHSIIINDGLYYFVQKFMSVKIELRSNRVGFLAG